MCVCIFGSSSVEYCFRVTVTLTSVLVKKGFQSISLILLEVGNLVCGYILWLRSVAYCFRVILTLTSVLEKYCPEHIFYII